MQSDYGTYLSIPLVAIGLFYLYSSEWERLRVATKAALFWPKRLVRLGMLLVFSGGVVIFSNALIAGVLAFPWYSATVLIGIGIYFPGIISVAAGFIMGRVRS